MHWPPWARNGHTPLLESAADTPQTTREVEHQVAQQYNDTIELLTERIAELEFASEDVFWQRLGTESATEFSRDYLRRIVRESRLYYLKNPLIQRAVSLQAFYVFGQGVSIRGNAPAVNEVVQAFLDDPANQTELTGHQARVAKEVSLQVEGNLFFVLFTDTTTGRVRVRTLPFDEVSDILTDPEDRKAPWYYKRVWSQHTMDLATGQETTTPQTTYYPDWRYQPTQRPAMIGGHPVSWDTPIYHLKVGGLDTMRFGMPETYAALDWASAYKKFLENWSTIVDSLSRFAWKMQPKGGARGVAAAKMKLGTTVGDGGGGFERNPPPGTGSIAILPEGADLTPIPKTGATVAADDGRRLLLMVCAAVGVPEPMFGDAKVGNHATAKTLDRPTELRFMNRRTLWADVFVDLLSYVIDQSALAQQGPLRAAPRSAGDQLELAPDPETGEPTDRGITVDFPSILEHDQVDSVAAVVNAITLGGHPAAGVLDPKTSARLLLQALGVADIDERLAELFPEDDGSGTVDDTAQDVPPSDAPVAQPGDVGGVLGEAARALTITAADIKRAKAWVVGLKEPELEAVSGNGKA